MRTSEEEKRDFQIERLGREREKECVCVCEREREREIKSF